MENSEIISNINNYSDDQIGKHNQDCTSKVYSEDSGNISSSEADIVEDTVEALELLSQDEIDNHISPNLNNNTKLSGRPC